MAHELDELMEKALEMAEKLKDISCDSVTKDDFPDLFDIVKDIAETKKYLAEASYYHSIVEAMENNKDFKYYPDWLKKETDNETV